MPVIKAILILEYLEENSMEFTNTFEVLQKHVHALSTKPWKPWSEPALKPWSEPAFVSYDTKSRHCFVGQIIISENDLISLKLKFSDICYKPVVFFEVSRRT